MSVNVGLIMDLRNPQRWHSDPSRVYSFALEACEEADRLGVHSLWTTEHHLFDDGYLPRPLTFAAAVAARTRHARIGTSVLIAPLHSAVSIAEDAAIVDLISGGRLELGLGAGHRHTEFSLYDAPYRGRFDMTDERVRELRRIWSEGRVTPRPVQDRIPIWMGYNQPSGARRAAALGEGLLSANPEMAAHYSAAAKAAGNPDESIRVAGFLSLFVTDDPERDWPVVSEHWADQWNSYRQHSVHGTDTVPPPPIDPDEARAAGVGAQQGHFFIGTPKDAARAVADYLGASPLQTMMTMARLPGMSEDMTMSHLALLLTEFAPELGRLTRKP
jgi:alkanesulfonate monooxygenase SsuD/methylene tetrahydromethanopterin reductase-like flavin-dependent oxidoreductase (luciferase family)